MTFEGEKLQFYYFAFLSLNTTISYLTQTCAKIETLIKNEERLNKSKQIENKVNKLKIK